MLSESTPNSEMFCDECGGPYDGWLKDQYGGHWDTCPNRVQSTPNPERDALAEVIRKQAARGQYQMVTDTLPYESWSKGLADAVLAAGYRPQETDNS